MQETKETSLITKEGFAQCVLEKLYHAVLLVL